MAEIHGNSGVAYVGANQVLEVKSFTYNETVELLDASVAGDTEVKWIGGGKRDGSGSVTCLWDPTDTNGQTTLRAGQTVTLHLYWSGNAAGETEHTGNVVIESHDISQDDRAIETVTFNFKGVLTEGVAP